MQIVGGEFGRGKIDDLKDEAKKRIESHLHSANDIIKSPRVTLPQSIDNLIYVDTNKSRLYLFEIKNHTLIKIFTNMPPLEKMDQVKTLKGTKKHHWECILLEKK